MPYRKDIQILRGIAVLLVVLFHFEVAGFNSGFLGVDVFFVISGYLMAIMYDPSAKTEFFVKRAKRLLPAYFAVVIVTSLLAIGITKPGEQNQVSTQALFATFFASNIGFWMENSYFNKAAFNPLLHLWSLGVEIQFYLLIPFLFWFFNRVKIGFHVTLAGSVILCAVVVGVSPKTAFFWLPFRLWEFLIGFGVAKYLSSWRAGKHESLAWLGAASLVAIICLPYIEVDVWALGFVRGHPGLAALLISFATATTLCFGLPKTLEANPMSGMLEKAGRYSYSIYLAHFPVIVLFLYQPFSGTILKAANIGQAMVLAVLVACASALLFTFVEQPFRKKSHVWRWVAASAAVVVGINSLGATVQKALISEQEMLIHQAWLDRSEYRCGKVKRLLNPTAITCEITDPIKSPAHTVLLVGNSHGDSIKATFSEAAMAANVSVYFMVENNPLMSGGITPMGLIEEALRRNADAIVLHYSSGALDPRVVEQVVKLAKEKSIQVSFIMPVPVWSRHVPTMLIEVLKGTEKESLQSIEDYKKANRSLMTGIGNIEFSNFKTYQTADILCPDRCMLTSASGRPLYFDNSHLTLTGSAMLKGVFERMIADLSEPLKIRRSVPQG